MYLQLHNTKEVTNQSTALHLREGEGVARGVDRAAIPLVLVYVALAKVS